jgi:hypothetical protein
MIEQRTMANRCNAILSTGPKTAAGKEISSRNALRHGIRSALPVLPGEQEEDWTLHQEGIRRSLAPIGDLEAELVGRVTLCLWRLRRVTAYETAVATAGIEEVEEETAAAAEKVRNTFWSFSQEHERPLAERLTNAEKELEKERREDQDKIETATQAHALLESLAQMDETALVHGPTACDVLRGVGRLVPKDKGFKVFNEDFLRELGVPKRLKGYIYEWTGWTAGLVRRALARVAAEGGIAPEALLAQALKIRLAHLEKCKAAAANNNTARGLERKVLDLRRRVRIEEERKRQARILPDEKTLEKVMRYEAHVSRQMLQALHTLERLQAARAGADVPPPAALDVTVSESRPLLEEGLVNGDRG